MAEIDDLFLALERADAAGNTADARELAKMISMVSSGVSAPPEPKIKQNSGSMGDIGTALKETAVGSVKSMTDVFGAENPASQYLGDVQQRINKEYSQKAVEEMQRRQEIIKEAEKSGSTLKEIQAYLGGVAEAPLRAGAQGVGSLLPYIGTGALGTGAKALGLASKILPSARAVNIGLGAAQGAGAVKGSIYDTVEAELRAKGESPEVAAEKASQAQAYSMQNAVPIGLGAVLGGAGAKFGVENLVTPGIVNRLNAKLIPRIATAAAAEAPLEGLQAGQEQYAVNQALQRQGFDRDAMQGVYGSAARDAAIGALVAAPIGAISRGETAPPKPVLEPNKAQEPEELAKQSNPKIYNPAVRQSAPEIAAMLLPEMKRFGLENVGLKVMDSIENGSADGMWANNLVHVALDMPNPMGSMRHESVHALKQLGGFQENEWSALNNKAKSEWLDTFIKKTGKYEQYKQIYQKENKTLAGFEDYIHEEAIAEAFRYFDKNGAPEGMIGAIYEKLKLMFEALRNGFTGAGFQSADSIFRSIESGTREQVAAPEGTMGGARYAKPDTRRLEMDFKDVTKRVPELTAAAEKVANGEMTAAQYDKLVNRYKPILPYDFVPQPTTKEEAVNALKQDQKDKYGKTNEIPNGHRVGLRLDIPAYTNKGAWVNSIHNEGNDSMPFKVTYSNVSAVKNASFEMKHPDLFLNYARAAKDKKGETQAKFPGARIMGDWTPVNEKTAIKKMQAALNDPAWTQVGMDPERHSYFYDRKTTQPILSADEVIQIGPLVLAKNAKFGSKKDFKYSLGDEDGTKGFVGKVPKGKAGKNATEARGLSGQGELSRVAELLPSTGRFLAETENLGNVPPNLSKVNVPTVGDYDFGANPVARQAAANYMKGKSYRPATQYMPVDVKRAKRIAQAYEKMKDDPNDPRVKASYEAMAKETLAQYAEIKKTGLQVEFINENMDDPYRFSPRLAIIDANNNNHLWVFPTDFGYGDSGALDDPNNPMLAYTDEMISGKKARVNDIFRIVHDYFGHIKDGVGFRAGGEENAWRSHVEMYSPLARLAMTTETRGQNSWVNFGPEADFNKTASGVDTKYAPQKLGLLPDEFIYSGAPSETDYNPSTLIINGLFNPELKGKPTVDQVGAYFDSLHTKPLDYKDPNTFRRMVQFASEEIKDQLKQEDSGLDWYDEDIRDAFNDTIKVIPELKDVENRQLFNVIAGIQSPSTNAQENWVIAAEAFKHYIDTNEIPQVNPKNGRLWMGGLTSANKKKQLNLLNKIVQGMGKSTAIEWLYSDHTVAEINQIRRQYGNLGSIDGKKNDVVLGLYALGPKIGPFVSNLNGIYDVTVDKWMTRTFKRYIGNMINDEGKIIDAPTPSERAVIKQFINEVAKNEGIKPYQAQSILWFYEQRLFRSFGTQSPSYGFSDGARKFLEQNTAGGEGSGQQDGKRSTKADQKPKVDRKLSIVAPDTKEFKQWFGDSKVVNSDGKPKVYYHGTAQDITEFKPKQANAIFLTDNPRFAKGFSQLSKHYMEQDAFNSASQEEKVAQLQSVRKLLEEDGRDTDLIAKDIRKLKKGEKLPSDFYISGGYSDLLDYVNRDNAGAENILPVFVKANNPFDYQNIKHIEKVLKVATPEEMQPILQRASYNPERLKRIIGEGSWNTIESPQFQSAVRRAGFDAFYVSEGGNKNLAVYDSSQIKSFTNQAPTESKDIRFSVALNNLEPDTFLTSDKNPNALGNLGFMPTNSPFPKNRPIRLTVGIKEDYIPKQGKIVKAYGARHILTRALTDVGHRPEEVTKEALEDTILHIENLSKRFNRVYEDRGSFVLYDSQSDDLMIVSPITDKVNGDYYGVTTMYSNPDAPRKYGNPKWTGKNIQPPVVETGLKAKGISVRANKEGDIVPSAVPTARKEFRTISPNQIEEIAEGQTRKTGTLGVKKKLSVAPNAPPQGTLTTLVPHKTAGKRLTDTITSVIDFFKDPEKRMEARIAFVDPNSALAKRLENQPLYDVNGVLRADLLARGKATTINIIRNGLQTGIPVINSDGSIIIQSDPVNNLANSQAIADRLNNNQYVIDSGLDGRIFVADVARALRGKEIMAEDKAYNKTQKNVKKHQNREKQVKPEQIQWAEQQLKNVPELQEIFDIWKNVNTGLINLWEETGLFSKKQADEYRSKKHYVSLAASYADLETMMADQLGFTASGLKSVGKVHELKGAEYLRDKNGVIQKDENGEPILLKRNIWENIDKQYASMLAAAYQNQVRKIAVEQLIGAGNGAASIPSRMKNGVEVGAPLTKGINLKYKDPTNPLADHQGVVHAIVTNPIDLAAFETFHYELTPLMKFAGGATKALRIGALVNPMFWIRQLIRDPIHATLVANSGITTPFHSAKEFINILAKNSPEARILAERGVIGQYDSTLDLHSYLEQAGKEQMPKGKLNNMLHRLMQIHEASDAATRVSIFKKEKEAGLNKGMTEDEATNFAVMKARESINFMIHGNSKSLNSLRQMIPFLSASITSLDTVYRAATGYGLPPAEKAAAKKLFKQRAALMLGSTVAYAMLMQDDDEYKKLPDYVKDNNWLIKNPTGEGFIKVPVPYEVGFLFKTLPEVAIRYMNGTSTGKEVVKSYYDGFMHNLPTGGVPVPQVVKPALETIANYSFFTGNPIESIGESRLPVEMRGRNASETAKFLSESGLGKVGLSPAKIDNLMQGYFAEAGTFVFTLSDQLITTVEGKEPTTKNLAKQPFFKSFLTDPNSDKAVADFYQIEQTANQVAQEFSHMTQTGLGSEAVAFMQDEDKRKLIASAPALRRVATNMTAIRKAIETINNNQAMSPDDRRDRVNQLTAQYNRVAEQGVKLANTLGIR
jgi:hypothetical protein